MTASYRTTRTPVLPWAAGDVCLRGRMFGLVEAGINGMAPSGVGHTIQRWAHHPSTPSIPSIQVTTNLKAFAASQYQGADP